MGSTLDERMAAGAIPLQDALPIARQFAEALRAAHEKRVVHRDLQPTIRAIRGASRRLEQPVSAARTAAHLPGRDPSAAIHIDSAQASWHHARMVVTSGSVVIEDLTSKHGTMVNSTWIAAPTRLLDGDELQIGTMRFVLRTGEKPAETQTR
ncbi:MAG: FHA domain-containing protein [Acidobacteria bacterium]|nr:FHA domain-containing protein [Acidobacteriota bacterium]